MGGTVQVGLIGSRFIAAIHAESLNTDWYAADQAINLFHWNRISRFS